MAPTHTLTRRGKSNTREQAQTSTTVKVGDITKQQNQEEKGPNNPSLFETYNQKLEYGCPEDSDSALVFQLLSPKLLSVTVPYKDES